MRTKRTKPDESHDFAPGNRGRKGREPYRVRPFARPSSVEELAGNLTAGDLDDPGLDLLAYARSLAPGARP